MARLALSRCKKKGDRVGAIKYTLVHLKCTHDVSIWKFANNMKEKHKMQYTLRCREEKKSRRRIWNARDEKARQYTVAVEIPRRRGCVRKKKNEK